MTLARDAIAEDGNDPSVLRWAGHTLGFWGDYDTSLAILEKAARLNVNGSLVLSSLGWVMNYACLTPDRAISNFERAMRLSPRDPETNLFLGGIALAHIIAGRNEVALWFAQKGIDDSPRFLTCHRIKVSALGRLQEANAAAKVLLGFDPAFRISNRVPLWRDQHFMQEYHAKQKAAGLPE